MNAQKHKSAVFEAAQCRVFRQFSGGMHQAPMFCFVVDTWPDIYVKFF